MEEDISKYELDRDIPDRIWNGYLKRKYGSRFFGFWDEDGVWRIKCKQGKIDIFSLKKGFLHFIGSHDSPHKKTYFMKRTCHSLPDIFEITQEGYDEVSLKFRESDFERFIDLLEVRKRPRISDAERKRRSERAKKNFGALATRHVSPKNI